MRAIYAFQLALFYRRFKGSNNPSTLCAFAPLRENISHAKAQRRKEKQ
jgi:hypothetical protein